MSSKAEYISVRRFALLTGLSPSEIEGKFTVKVGNRLLVPLFMTDGREQCDIAHIELPPEPPEENNYLPLARLELDLDDTANSRLQTIRLESLPAPFGAQQEISATNATEQVRRGSKARGLSRQDLLIHVNPYRRLTARIADLTWETVLVLACMLWLTNHLSATLAETIQQPLLLVVLAIFLAPFILLLDALIYTLAGNTPGKSMLGLKVVSRGLKNLSFTRYFLRNFRMWREAFAYGVLPVSLFYMARQGDRVSKGMETLYDQLGHTRVGQRQHTRVTDMLWGLGVIILLIAVAAGIRNAAGV